MNSGSPREKPNAGAVALAWYAMRPFLRVFNIHFGCIVHPASRIVVHGVATVMSSRVSGLRTQPGRPRREVSEHGFGRSHPAKPARLTAQNHFTPGGWFWDSPRRSGEAVTELELCRKLLSLQRMRRWRPPSTWITSPVENGRAPAAMAATTRPTSAGVPQRRIGETPPAIRAEWAA